MTAEYGQNNSFQIFVDVVVSMAYICICILCWFLIYFQRQNEEKTRMLEIERKLKESQNRYYQFMLEKEAETRKFRHDLNNHLFCLKEMAEREDIDEIKKYLDGMNGEMQKIKGATYSTGNELFDAILNDKLLGLPENVSVTVKGTFCHELSIEAIDMCTIFSNLLQNAVEEVKKISGQGFLDVEIRSGQQFTEIEIKNSAIKKVKLQKDGLPKTSKEDDRNHGIGLKNVKKTIEKCHGEFVIISEEGFFSVRVSFSKSLIRE